MRSLCDLVARAGRLCGLVLALLLGGATAAPAASLVVQPSSQDAFIVKNTPNRIAGRVDRIRVAASPSGTKLARGLVQFPLASIPRGSTITSAVVELFATFDAHDPALTHGLFPIETAWLETAVKWSNQPTTVFHPTATAIVGDARGFKSFVVTPDVQSAIDQCSNDHGWMIKDLAERGGNEFINYVSREIPHAVHAPERPKLTVQFTPPTCVSDADCQDTAACTTDERCRGGICVVTEVGCDDGNPCTTDICDCGRGCVNEPICNDGFSCTTDTCDPATLECTNTPVDSACVTECSTGTCVADPDSITVDPTTGCQITATSPAGTPCSDGEPCTTPDECNGTGTCVAGPADCDDPSCSGTAVCPLEEGDCDNCVDDDWDGLTDRDDPQCAQHADGDGQGVGDAKFRGKRIVRCQKAIRGAASRFEQAVRAKLQRCTDGVFRCLQQKPGDADCLLAARIRCLRQTAALQGSPADLDARLTAKINGACGVKKPGVPAQVSGADFCGARGLGFASEASGCQNPEAPGLLASVARTLADEHLCRALQLFAADVPRAAELLGAGGVDPSGLPCLLEGAQGGNLGLGRSKDTLRAVVGCQKTIGAAGSRFVKQVLAAEQRCSEAMTQCIQTKPTDPRCPIKAKALCRKVTARLFLGPKSREAKLKGSIARACGPRQPGQAPRVELADLRSVIGLGYDTLQSTCTVLGVPGLLSLDAVSECLVRQHVCRAEQILTSQSPRSHELLELGGAVRRSP